jgi:hypothetical protein
MRNYFSLDIHQLRPGSYPSRLDFVASQGAIVYREDYPRATRIVGELIGGRFGVGIKLGKVEATFAGEKVARQSLPSAMGGEQIDFTGQNGYRQMVMVVDHAKLFALAEAARVAPRVLHGLKPGRQGMTLSAKPNATACIAETFGKMLDRAVAGEIDADQVVIATGSSARALPGTPFDEKDVLSNEGALALTTVPKRLGLIGSGVIGLEMGSVWRRLGAEVTVLEGLPTFLGAVDEQIAKEAKKAFDKQGLKINLGVKVGAVTVSGQGVSIAYADAKGVAQMLDVDKLIVSIGRVPNTQGLNAQAVGLQLDERGAIVVDGDCRTNLPGVWAVGDVVRGPMLAHKAEEEGVAVAERIAGQHGHVDFNLIPWVIYTSPEIAWVGQTEQQLKASGRAYRAGSFPFLANGRARALALGRRGAHRLPAVRHAHAPAAASGAYQPERAPRRS